MRSSIILSVFMLLAGSFSVFAQETGLFGDDQQPGNRLHQQIVTSIEQGTSEAEAIQASIVDALTEESTILTTDSKIAVSVNINLSGEFYTQMLASNSLIEVTKVLIEENNALASQVVALGTYLYPDFAQEVVNGAILTGVITEEDAITIALASGADPTTITTATAAAAAPVATPPIGAGIGGGGAGGGDTTASTN